MPSWWRLLLVVLLVVVIPLTVYPRTADAAFSGISENHVNITEVDDDVDDMLRRLRSQAAAGTRPGVFQTALPRLSHLSHGLLGADRASWSGRPPADRGPPGEPVRHQAVSASSVGPLGPDMNQAPSTASSKPTEPDHKAVPTHAHG